MKILILFLIIAGFGCSSGLQRLVLNIEKNNSFDLFENRSIELPELKIEDISDYEGSL